MIICVCIIVGNCNKALSECLQLDAELTLEKASCETARGCIGIPRNARHGYKKAQVNGKIPYAKICARTGTLHAFY